MDIQTNYVAFQDLLEMKSPKSPISPTNPNDQTPPPAASSFQLNPAAEEWSPAKIPEDHRSLFMTFSKGHPLTKPEIVDYFYRYIYIIFIYQFIFTVVTIPLFNNLFFYKT